MWEIEKGRGRKHQYDQDQRDAIIAATLQTKPDGSQRVVLINLPHENVKSVGFVTRIFTDASSGREIAAVYVPTTPNPTGGYLELVPVEELTPTDWSVDQAMTFILSGGAVSPDKYVPFDKIAGLNTTG